MKKDKSLVQKNQAEERDWCQRLYPLLEQREYEQAVILLRRWLQAEEDNPEAWGFLASVGIEMSNDALAGEGIEHLLVLQPADAYTLFLQARFRFQQGERMQLIPELERILQGAARIPTAYLEKIYNLLGQCWRFVGESAKSACYYKLAAQAATTRGLRALEYSNYLFNLHYLAAEPEKVFQEHCRYDEIFADVTRFLHRRRQDEAGRKIRLGYISPDFRNHVVLRFCYAMLSGYDKEQFLVFGYSTGQIDEYTKKAASLTDGWQDLAGLEPAVAARTIYEDGIDILFDLSGHTKGSCLPILAYKPAPVQVSGIGYFATTGLQAVDYFLGDVYLDAVEEDRCFLEKIWRLPHSHFCYTPLGAMPQPGQAACSRKDYVTFGSFNNFTKVTDEVMQVWAEIMRRLPKAHILLKAETFCEAASREHALLRLRRNGLDESRLELRVFSRDYMAEYNEVDIALDTFPYPGGGTTCDALYMGVPVVTLCGGSHGARFGYSLLMNLGLGELAAFSVPQYVDIACALAQDKEALIALHNGLRTLMCNSRLLSGTSYMADLETAYKDIWQNFCMTQPTVSYQERLPLLLKMRKFLAGHDNRQALALADAVLAAGEDQRPVLEELAALYIDAGEARQSGEAVRRLLAGSPDAYDLFLAARAENLAGEYAEAQRHCQAALSDGLAQQQKGLAYDLLGRLAKQTGKLRQAAKAYRQAASCLTQKEEKAACYSNYLFCLNYLQLTPREIMTEAAGYGQLWADLPQLHPVVQRKDKLRIGYISPDFCYHVVAFFSYALFRYYDHSRYEVFCYAACTEDSASREIASMVDGWRNIKGLAALEAAELIEEDHIDILFDLAGHTKDNCLPVLACKPALVQISGIGYFATTGLPAVDYFLGDSYLDGQGSAVKAWGQEAFREKLLLLPHSHFCYTEHNAPAVFPLPPCVQRGYVTFGCFNAFSKLSLPMLQIWQKILQAVPGSRLLLKSGFYDASQGRSCAESLLREAGIDLGRVTLEGYTSDYMAAYAGIDIALDTFPYPGGGTTCDALYMGIPVITLYGHSHNSRFGYSLLMNIGLGELAASEVSGYIERAVALAGDTATLKKLHTVIRPMMAASPLMDGRAYARDMEKAYDFVWHKFSEEGMVHG